MAADLLEPAAHPRTTLADPVEAGDGDRLEPPHVAVGIDMDDLGQLVVVDHREGQHDLPAGRRARLEKVLLGTDCAGHRGDDLLADRIQRWVGHLREELREVVEQQPRAVRQHRDRRVRTHRAERLQTVGRHRRDDALELLVGVTESLLPAQHRLVRVADVLTVGQPVEVHQTGVQPVVVGMLGGQGRLHLVVADDPAQHSVDEEHPARLQPALRHDRGRVEVEHADLAGQDDQVVAGLPPPRRPQAVAVEHCADDGAVGEGHRRRPVPRLHQRRVELVEGAPGRVHPLGVLPRLGHHHQHGMRQRAASQVQQLQHLVEGGGVTQFRGADREDPGELAGQVFGAQQGFAGPHPVTIAPDRVDLAVVGEIAVRMRQRPGRERVGAEPAMHEDQRGVEQRVGQVREEGGQLVSGQHPLVDQGAAGQRREVDLEAGVTGGVLHPLAGDVGQPLQRQAGRASDVELPESRHDFQRLRSHSGRIGWQLPPAEDVEPLLGDDPLDELDRPPELGVGDGQEGVAHGVRRFAVHGRRRQRDTGNLAKERVRNLHQQAGPVARGRVAAGGAAMLHVVQSGEALLNEPMRPAAPGVHHKGHTAGVALGSRVVQALRARHGGEAHRAGPLVVGRNGRNARSGRDDIGRVAALGSQGCPGQALVQLTPVCPMPG